MLPSSEYTALINLVIPREAPSREVYNLVAREACVYHTSTSRPAWFSRVWFVSALTSSRVVTSKWIMSFQATGLSSTTNLRVLFMKRVFSYVNYNNVYGRWITIQYLRQIKKTANSSTVDSTSGWKSSLGKIYKQNSARPRTSTSNSGCAIWRPVLVKIMTIKFAPQVNLIPTTENIMDLLCIFVVTKQYFFQRVSNYF